MTRFLVQTRRSGSWALDRLEEAVERRRARPDADDGSWVAAVEAEQRVCLLIDVARAGRTAPGEAERIFEQVWYDAFGDRGGGHLVVPLW